MPWTQPTGNDNQNNSGGDGPWQRPPPGGGGGNSGGPPDFEELLRRAQEAWRRLMPGGGAPQLPASSGVLIGLGLLLLWLLSGIYSVGAREQGVVLRFGQFVARTGPGINYHLPWPIEHVLVQNVTETHQIDIGHATGDASQASDQAGESLMLTGDENIVDVNFTVYWVIKDAGAYLFNVQDTDQTIRAVAESAMREAVGETALEPILTQDREPIQIEVRKLMQKTLDSYGAGVTVTGVQLQRASPPAEVLAAYGDVQAARADQERMRNEGEAYANKVIPEARGAAAQIVQNAQAYKQQAIAEAAGDAKRFLSVLGAYRLAPEVTRKRIYLDTMAKIFGQTDKVVIDPAASKGVLPYLPLPAPHGNRGASVSVSEGPAVSITGRKGGGQ